MIKRGQMQLSFGMIFSIIIIVATIAVAFYFIQKVLAAQECAKIELFKEDLQESIDKVWRSPFASQEFSSTIPAGIKKVCIGNPANAPAMYSKIISEADPYLDPDENLIFYPPKEACSGRFAAASLGHVDDLDGLKNSFSCFDSVNGKVSFVISKERIRKP